MTNSVAREQQSTERRLRDLAGVGPRIQANLHRLGVHDVVTLARQDGDELYRQLGEMEGTKPDPCVLDTFRCAVAQARNPLIISEQKNWWWWSRERKAGRLPDVK